MAVGRRRPTLTNLGLANHLRGYPMYDDYAVENRPARIIAALTSGEIDAAAVWGPLAGYYAPRAAAARDRSDPARVRRSAAEAGEKRRSAAVIAARMLRPARNGKSAAA